MSKSSLGNTTEAHLVVLDDSKQREDVKLYSQLPDYDDFRCYDLGREDLLRQVTRRIYANFHKPSRRTLKTHLFPAGAREKLSGELNRYRKMAKRAISNMKECLEEWLKSQYTILSMS